MDTLMTLKGVVEENKVKYGPDMTVSLEKSILSMGQKAKKNKTHQLADSNIMPWTQIYFAVAKEEADRLFEDVLKRKDEADRTRNALGILQRFRFLFHLPSSLDKNIQKADYDLVINDYARAKALFGNTEVQVIICLEAWMSFITEVVHIPSFNTDIPKSASGSRTAYT